MTAERFYTEDEFQAIVQKAQRLGWDVSKDSPLNQWTVGQLEYQVSQIGEA